MASFSLQQESTILSYYLLLLIVTSPLGHASEYDVFVSFRGPDVRDTFLRHLLAALKAQKINVFIDDTDLEKGVEISSGLLKVIEESKVAMIIFLRDYASSSWCLDELVMIMERKIINKIRVIPIFYRIDPTDVENQSGSYGDAFNKHVKSLEDKEKIEKWRNALREASYLVGWDSKNIRPDATLVEAIVKDTAKILKQEFSHLSQNETGCNTSEGIILNPSEVQRSSLKNPRPCLYSVTNPDDHGLNTNRSYSYIYIQLQ